MVLNIFLYIGGHGELARIGDPSFILTGNNELRLSDFRNILTGEKVLMITDSCQSFSLYGQGGVLSEDLRMFYSESVTHLYRARRKFDQKIRELEPSFTYASSVSPGQSASDTSNGGLYTQNLLKSCKKITNNNGSPNQVYGICLPHYIASQKVNKLTKGKQTPFISGYTRTSQSPFVVKL